MWKVQLFIFVEAILLSMALVTMLAADFSRVVLIMLLFLLFLYYYFGKQRGNFAVVATMIVFFFICHAQSLRYSRCPFRIDLRHDRSLSLSLQRKSRDPSFL